MAWYDFYKLFSYSFEEDPQTKAAKSRDFSGAGFAGPDVIPFMRQDGQFGSGGTGSLRVGTDMVDMSSVSTRAGRYKEYERLRSIPEIEQVMTVIADEACVTGDTLVNTLADGLKPIKWLAENKKEDFFVYCWDFQKNDYTLGLAYDPRMVKKAKTYKIFLDDGTKFEATSDHLVLLRNGAWSTTGTLKVGDKLMPFYRVSANQNLTQNRKNQFPRIFTYNEGWVHERQFIDEWKCGKSIEKYDRVNKAVRMLTGGLTTNEISKLMGHGWGDIHRWIVSEGFSTKEIRWLSKKEDNRRVVAISEGAETDVYDLSVKDHKNFCGESVIFHNCQKNNDRNVIEITCKNKEVVEELNFLFLHRKMINLNRQAWNWIKRLAINGDFFGEIIINPDNPKDGILKVQELPPDSMYRIETTKSKLLEFQQGNEGPDYEALVRTPVRDATDAEMDQCKTVRFVPEQIVHMRLGEDRKTFYPYGQSLIEPARGPAHQLRLMEDAMVVYRLCLIGETRIRTNNGYKYLKDIREGDVVYSYSPIEHSIKPTKVLNFMNNGIKELLRVRSKHIEIIGTKTHPILVNRDNVIQYVEMQNLQIKKDKLISVQNEESVEVEIPRIFGERWAKLSENQRTEFRNKTYKNKSDLLRKCPSFDRAKQFLYCAGKALPEKIAIEICNIFDLDSKKLILVNKGESNSERVNLPKYVDADFARLFGFLCGDGNINNCRLSFSTSPDVEINNFYKNLLEKYFQVASFQQDKRLKDGLGKITVCSNTACKVFLQMGYINDHNKNRVPNWVFNASKSIRKAFVEGLSDADGCERFTKARTWFSTIELSNKQLIEDVKELWSSIGLASGHIKTRHRKGGHEIQPGRKMPDSTSHIVTISDCILPKFENVLNIDEFGEQEVFDITVDNEEHNFIANGTPVHNSRAPERRVFYIDVGTMSSYRAETFMTRMQDLLRKKKVVTKPGDGASTVDERYSAPTADEDFWIPVRANSNTRIETLPGAQNLGEIDDTVYFRNKLYISLNFPQNYFANEDANSTRVTLSSQIVKFARMIERIQEHMEDGLWEIADRHLQLRGFPEEVYEDLIIKMTPPSEWRELSRAEIDNGRINNANALKGSLLYSDWDILTKILKHPEEVSTQMISRMKIQKLEDARLQILVQNPQLSGIGVPGADGGEDQMGTEPDGPNPMPTPDQNEPNQNPEQEQAPEPDQNPKQKSNGASNIPEPEDDDLKRYDMEIQSYSRDQDFEDVDFSEL